MKQVHPETKAILSLPLAQRLMDKGFNLIRIEPSHRRRGMLAFIFEYCDELDAEIDNYAARKE